MSVCNYILFFTLLNKDSASLKLCYTFQLGKSGATREQSASMNHPRYYFSMLATIQYMVRPMLYASSCLPPIPIFTIGGSVKGNSYSQNIYEFDLDAPERSWIGIKSTNHAPSFHSCTVESYQGQRCYQWQQRWTSKKGGVLY